MSKSLKQVASEMDPLAAKGTEVLLSSVLRQHRFPIGFPASARGLGEIVRRHTTAITVKFLSYNTFRLIPSTSTMVLKLISNPTCNFAMRM